MQGLKDLILAVGRLVDTLLSIVVALAVLVFFWGLVTYLFKAGDEKSHSEGRNKMVWGTIALFVMVTIWGLVHFIALALGISDGAGLIHWGWDDLRQPGQAVSLVHTIRYYQ